ncbi:GH1 / GH5_19 [Streptomyces misionensis JCM 4497]
MGHGHRGLPDRGGRRRGRPGALDLGHLLAHPREDRGRRQRRCRLRPLPPPGRGHRPDAPPRRQRLPALRRLAARRARRHRSGEPQGARVLRRVGGRSARGGHHPVRHPLPLGPAAGAPGPRRLAGAGHRPGLRRLRVRGRRPPRRPGHAVDDAQRALLLGLDRSLRGHDGARLDRSDRRRPRLLPSAPRPRPRRRGRPCRRPRRPDRHRQQPFHRAPGHRPPRGRGRGPPPRRPRQPLVARPGARPRLPRRHDRNLRRGTPVEVRRLGDDRGATGLAGPELLLPGPHHRRPRRPGAVRAFRTPRGCAAHRHGLGDRPERHRDPAAAPHRGVRRPHALRHRERLRLPRRGPSRRHRRRPRTPGLPRIPPGRLRLRDPPRRPPGRLLRLVAAGQLRVGVRLRQALRPRPRGLHHPEAHHQEQRSPLRGDRPRPRATAQRRRLSPASVSRGAGARGPRSPRRPPRLGQSEPVRVSAKAATASTAACSTSLMPTSSVLHPSSSTASR